MNATAPATSLWSSLQRGFTSFVAAPATAHPLAALRIGLSGALIVQALAIAASIVDLFAPTHAIVQWTLTESVLVPGMPRMRWLVELLAPLGVSEAACVRSVFILYVAGLSALMMGWHSRLAAVIAWFTHLTLMMSDRTPLYGVDDFAHIALFYCVWMPVGHAWSLDVSAGRVSAAPSFAARLGLRVLQIHLCVVYLTSGIEKATSPPYQWWNGELIWMTATSPDYGKLPMEWLANVPWLPLVAGLGALFIELAYAFLVWPKRTRVWMAGSTILLHLGIAVFMGLWSFAAVMIVLTASAWVVSPEPGRESQHADK
jgi:hypothetical protein